MDDDTEVFERRMRFRTRILRAAAARGYSLVQRALPSGDLVWCWTRDDDDGGGGDAGATTTAFTTKLEAVRSMRDTLRDDAAPTTRVVPGS